MKRRHPLSLVGRRNFLRVMGTGVAFTAFGGKMAWAAPTCDDPNYNPPDYPQDCTQASDNPVPYTPRPAGVVPRKSAFELTTAELKKLRAAYAALHALPATDPRGWINQGNIHCWYCGGGSGGQQGMEIHSSWWFLPWHRAFLYFHERILGSLINDPSFRLPYWDWDTQTATPSHQTMPPEFPLPALASNSLFNKRRRSSATDKIPLTYVGPQAMANVLGQSTFTTFGGGSDAHTAGQLELIPHNNVHNWTGTNGEAMPDCGTDMGVLATAARDPIFFAHHSNVDRCWELWKAVDPATHVNPTDAAWLSQTWTFHDENSKLVSIRVQDVLTTEGLGYTYGVTESTPVVAATSKRVRRAAPATAAATTGTAALAPLVLMSQEQGVALDPKPKTYTVKQLPAPHRNLMAADPKAPAGAKRFVLRIEGVEVPMTRGAQVLVFVNQPNATAASPTNTPNYVGMISAVAHTRGGGHDHGKTFDVPIELLPETEKLISKQGTLSVTLVPVDPNGKAPKKITLRYKRIVLEAM